ncbi:hypothetical protein CEXT_756351 [Caerostris extrusa]|uniref:Uncharacterized protein n=1 Tax=Caerostris extrusa TaxID=172846 RepID=A0AAV4PWN5_CAEEX|nr:hypothetical protein CEXT_756351 [Caerostris extrusa]
MDGLPHLCVRHESHPKDAGVSFSVGSAHTARVLFLPNSSEQSWDFSNAGAFLFLQNWKEDRQRPLAEEVGLHSCEDTTLGWVTQLRRADLHLRYLRCLTEKRYIGLWMLMTNPPPTAFPD